MTASISQAKNRDYLLKDYYHNDVERPGVWLGSGARVLGLAGEVETQDWKQVWTGKDPLSGEKLVMNAGSEKRLAGHDVTLSAPKSVSVAWGIGDIEVKERIEQAQHLATLDAIQYMEDNAAYTRIGKDGAGGERQVGLVVGSFQHGTNRENKPQLHTHNLVFNVGTREDGKTGALNSRHLYQSKMATGAVYRARLATEVERAGFEIERKEDGTFEIKGMSKALMDALSTRSAQINEYLQEHGLKNSPQNRETAAIATRQEKVYLPEEEMRGYWADTAAEHGVSQETIRSLRKEERQELSELERRRNQDQSLDRALDKLLTHQSYFSEKELDRKIAESAIGQGLVYSDLKAAKERFIASSEAIEVEGESNLRFFTTQKQLDMEANLYESTMSREQDKSHTVSSKQYFNALSERPTMSSEQRVALRHMTSAGGVKVVSGWAGTGKTYVLNAANDVWSNSGYTVQGLALSAKAADGLQEANIESRTIDSFLMSLDYKRQKAQENGHKDPSVMAAKTILVVDESGMVDTKRMARLFEEADKAGSKVVLVGDASQLQAVNSGGSFQAIRRQVGDIELKEIRRQKDAWAREAVLDFEAGRAAKALDAFDKRGQFIVEGDRKALRERLIDDWNKGGGVQDAKEHLILAQTNVEVRELNRLAQERRKEAGELGNTWSYVGGSRIYEGDRVMFGQNEKGVGVKNGQGGTVRGIDTIRQLFHVEMDSKKNVTFSTRDYKDVSLGYATTVHKSQGQTVDNAYVMTGGHWDRHLAYVAGSRARNKTQIYATGNKTKKDEVKKELSEKMSRDNQKELASDRILSQRQKRDNKLRVGQEL